MSRGRDREPAGIPGGWLYPNRSLRLTRDGWFFLAVTMAIGFASLNTGHNLFYLIFAMQVSLVIVSGLLSERAVRMLHVERRLPREIFARTATAVEIAVRNRSRRRTVYAVEIRDAIDDEPHRRLGFVDRLDPGAARSFHAVWTFGARGRHRFRAIHLVTRFPFGLFEKSRIVPLRQEILAFPAIDRAAARASSPDPSRATVRKHRLGEELFALRRKLPDDDPRHIHWRVSARVGELVVREPGSALERPLAIFFDSRGPAGSAFEAAVERTASLLWSTCGEGRRVSFYSWGFETRGVGRDTLREPLSFLAEVRASPAADRTRFERWLQESARAGGGLFVTAGDAPAVPPGTLLRVA